MVDLTSSGIPELKNLITSKMKEFSADLKEKPTVPGLEEIDEIESKLNFDNINPLADIEDKLDLSELENLDLESVIEGLIPDSDFFDGLIPDIDSIINF